MSEDNEKLLKNRFSELARRADEHCIWTETDFLTIAEQDILLSLKLPCILFGGYENAERRIAYFGSYEDTGYTYEPNITCVSIAPVSQKFADKLTHRDILGALMSLGIERKSTGDILIIDNIGYLFCLKDISGFIIENLSSVKHTTVKCDLCSPPKKLCEPPSPETVIVASERLDGLISAIYGLGRSAAKDLILSGKVYVSGRLASSGSIIVPEGSIISVRGFGRFQYDGITRATKKGRLCTSVRIYR